jgi:hypothetical protein
MKKIFSLLTILFSFNCIAQDCKMNEKVDKFTGIKITSTELIQNEEGQYPTFVFYKNPNSIYIDILSKRLMSGADVYLLLANLKKIYKANVSTETKASKTYPGYYVHTVNFNLTPIDLQKLSVSAVTDIRVGFIDFEISEEAGRKIIISAKCLNK